MPQQVQSTVENNFTKGLITEATGLNFPENAATSTSNCIYTLVGDVIRREGINNELNGTTASINRAGQAISNYVWTNVGGDGVTALEVVQVGGTLYFYSISNSTVASPLSTQRLVSTVTVSNFVVAGATFDPTQECTFADGNGYLFIFNPNCDPIYCTYSAGTVTATGINIQIRDFIGVVDGLPVNTRPQSLSVEHQYNIQNQGWVAGNPWQGTSTNVQPFVANTTNFWTTQPGLPVANGTLVTVYGHIGSQTSYLYAAASGTVTSYNSSTGVIGISIGSISGNDPLGTFNVWNFIPTSIGYVNTWFSAEANYPSNADVWWYFKDSTGAFNPLTTVNNVTLASGNAPQGKYILPVFNQSRSAASGVSGLTTVSTLQRPTVGAWFAGRVWYSGVAASQQASGDANFYSWSEDIYFSQVVQSVQNFGNCFQINDPTSENLFSPLATDGGVIRIQGSGIIKKLFPTQNGMLVFATNGIWFITGSQGIGFSASDYTITKISNIRSLNTQSFVNVLGLPYFWNEEGIYQVVTGPSGQLAAVPITVGTIQTFYDNIPLLSRKYVRGDYDPIAYVIQWSYRSIPEVDVTSRYQFDSILSYNTYNKAFYTYAIATSASNAFIHGVSYISYPIVTVNTPNPGFKYVSSFGSGTAWQFSFAEEYDPTFVDWAGSNYKSTFTTGYKLHGQAWRKFQVPYVYIYSRSNNAYAAYYIQGAWDYATGFDSNMWSQPQFAEVNDLNSNMFVKRHKIRGRGRSLQLMFTSVDGQPFDIMGWAMYDTVNMSN